MNCEDVNLISNIIRLNLASKKIDTELYDYFGQVNYAKLVDKYSGKRISIQVPDKEDVQEIYLKAFCWYYRKVKNLDCKKTKEALGVDISSVKINKYVKYIDKLLNS